MTDAVIIEAPSRERTQLRSRRLLSWAIKTLPFHVLLLVTVIGLWQFASDRWISSMTISSPLGIFEAGRAWIEQGYLQRHTWYTFQAVFAGFLIGSIIAFVLAVLFVEWPLVGRFSEPYIIAASVIPSIALIPIFIVWLGLGIEVKIVMGILATFFITFITSYQGLRNTDSNLLELARILGATRFQRVFKFRVWAALPFFMSGAKLALPKAGLAVVVAEFLTGNRGLGYAILRAGNNLDMGGFFVGVITLTITIYLLSLVLLLIERVALSWVPKERS